GLDGATPAEAFTRLLSLPDAEARLLPTLVAPERFDEYLFLRTAFSAYGPRSTEALEREFDKASGLRKALLLSLYRLTTASDAVKAAAKALKDRDWRVRREALATLGFLFNHERGEEPGR